MNAALAERWGGILRSVETAGIKELRSCTKTVKRRRKSPEEVFFPLKKRVRIVVFLVSVF
jgi:hypothetical protein